MTDDDIPETIESREDALAELRDLRGRSIVTAEFAYAVAEAFDVDRDALSVKPASELHRAMVAGDQDELCIGICDLTRDIVAALGGDPTTSAPYLGTGTSADHIGDANIEKLAEMMDADA